MSQLKGSYNSKWLRQSPYSVKETADRLLGKLAEYPSVMIIARVDQKKVAEFRDIKIREAECLLFQNCALVGKIISTNIEAGFDLPIKVFIWKADDGQVWIRCTDIDHMNNAYDLNGADGAVTEIYHLLPGWLDYTVSW
ncbi:DUF302 domain-containing protein [Dryocola sp. LX212]|jgi:uncharacterized protein (DUF302 family)